MRQGWPFYIVFSLRDTYLFPPNVLTTCVCHSVCVHCAGVEAGGDKAKSGASSVTAEPKEGTTANLKRGGQFGSDNKLPDPKRRRT